MTARPTDRALVSDQAPSGLAASRFDPSRVRNIHLSRHGMWIDGKKSTAAEVRAVLEALRVSDRSPQGQDAERLDPQDESTARRGRP